MKKQITLLTAVIMTTVLMLISSYNIVKASSKITVVEIKNYGFLSNLIVTVDLSAKTGTLIVVSDSIYESSGGTGPFKITDTYDKKTGVIHYRMTWRDVEEQYKNKSFDYKPTDSSYSTEITNMTDALNSAIQVTTNKKDLKNLQKVLSEIL